MSEWILLFLAAFFAGILNAIAGGGSFLTFPALVFAGVPPVAANATSAVAVFPGYLGAVAGFRREIWQFDRSLLIQYLFVSMAGGLCGALLLLITSNEIFSVLIPWLLLFATLVFGCGQPLLDRLRRGVPVYGKSGMVIIFVVSVYGGYFNGGLGIILLAALLFVGLKDLHLMNGLKNGISFAIAFISVSIFGVAGLVRWKEALLMMVAATLGGYFGAVIAQKIPINVLKYVITFIGLAMSVVFFMRM
jgi:uncharacterized membrane protein YfcA